jgi:hypothetical protein
MPPLPMSTMRSMMALNQMASPVAGVGEEGSCLEICVTPRDLGDAPPRVEAVAQPDGSTRSTRRPSDSPLISRRPRSVNPIGEPARSSRVAHEA